MLRSSDIVKYGIVLNTDIYSVIDWLFSGEKYEDDETSTNLDPYQEAHKVAGEMGVEFYDINIAICKNNACIVQVLVFRTKEGYDKYKKDGVLIFDHKE